MKYNFESEVESLHKKEVESLYKELEENNETYYKQVSDARYDNLHDYERDATASLVKRTIVMATIFFILITVYVLW